MDHERTERRKREHRVLPACCQHDRGVARVDVGKVTKMRVGDGRMQFWQKFREEDDVVRLGDQTSKIQVSV